MNASPALMGPTTHKNRSKLLQYQQLCLVEPRDVPYHIGLCKLAPEGEASPGGLLTITCHDQLSRTSTNLMYTIAQEKEMLKRKIDAKPLSDLDIPINTM